MMMDKKQIEKAVREIIGKRIPDVKPEAIDATIELDKLGMDSLAASWILADIEDAFNIVMPGKENCILKTLTTTVDYVEKNMSR